MDVSTSETARQITMETTELVALLTAVGSLIAVFVNRSSINAQIEKTRSEAELIRAQRDKERAVELANLQNQIDALEKEKDKLRSAYEALDSAYKAYKKSSEDQLERLHQRTEDLQKEHAAALEYNVMLNQNVREKQNEIAVLIKRLSEKDIVIEGQQAIILEFQQKVEELTRKVEVTRKETTRELKAITDELKER